MKKLIITCSIAFAIFNTNAQTYLLGGGNFANITKTNAGQTEKNNTLFTFNVGLLHRFDISKPIDFETGLLYTGRGSKAETYFNGSSDYVKSTFNPYYIELPLNAVFKAIDKKGNGLFFHAGPYASIGIAGKSKTNSKIGILTSSSESNIQFSNDDPFTSTQDDAAYNKLKRFDFGINMGAGLQLEHVLIRLNYGIGLTKINSTESNNNADDKNKFRTFSLSIGVPL